MVKIMSDEISHNKKSNYHSLSFNVTKCFICLHPILLLHITNLHKQNDSVLQSQKFLYNSLYLAALLAKTSMGGSNKLFSLSIQIKIKTYYIRL